MSPSPRDRSGLLAWYPPRWRERYGSELTALMDDTLGDQRPTPRLRASIAWAGLRERGHQAGMIGSTGPAADRARAGSLLVLCAWTAFVVAGSSLAKLAEGFQGAAPAGRRALSAGAYDGVVVLAVIAGLSVLSGVAIALPALRRFLRSGGWPSIRGHVLRASAASLVSVSALAGLIGLAHTLTPAQRNGGLLYHPVVWYYALAFIPTMLLVAGTLALWTVAAVGVARRLDLAPPVLSAEAVLSSLATVAMILMMAATAVWWAAISASAPWFLAGTRPGSAGLALDPQIVGTMALMVVASLVAAYGASRVVRSWEELHSTS